MFAEDYVELIAASAEGPGAGRVRSFLVGRGDGLMGLALGTRDAQLA